MWAAVGVTQNHDDVGLAQYSLSTGIARVDSQDAAAGSVVVVDRA